MIVSDRYERQLYRYLFPINNRSLKGEFVVYKANMAILTLTPIGKARLCNGDVSLWLDENISGGVLHFAKMGDRKLLLLSFSVFAYRFLFEEGIKPLNKDNWVIKE